MMLQTLYILPSEKRSTDRIVPAESVHVDLYEPHKDLSLSKQEREYRPTALVVKVKGDEAKIYPYLMRCAFCSEWTDIEAAAMWLGKNVTLDQPVAEDETIGRSLSRNFLATRQGDVYTYVMPSTSNAIFARLLPIKVDGQWLASQIRSDVKGDGTC